MFSEKPPPSSLKGNHFLDTYDDDDDERIIFFPPPLMPKEEAGSVPIGNSNIRCVREPLGISPIIGEYKARFFPNLWQCVTRDETLDFCVNYNTSYFLKRFTPPSAISQSFCRIIQELFFFSKAASTKIGLS